MTGENKVDIEQLIEDFQTSRDKQQRAIFASLYILGNRLQTSFDKIDPSVTMKQFMVLVMVRQLSERAIDLTSCGKLLGCSRQNIKKLAMALEAKELIAMNRSEEDKRKTILVLTKEGEHYFNSVETLHSHALATIFNGYSDKELSNFFDIFMKLYQGVEKLEITE